MNRLRVCLDLRVDLREWIWDDLRSKCLKSLVVWIKGKMVKFMWKVSEGCDRCNKDFNIF